MIMRNPSTYNSLYTMLQWQADSLTEELDYPGDGGFQFQHSTSKRAPVHFLFFFQNLDTWSDSQNKGIKRSEGSVCNISQCDKVAVQHSASMLY